MIVNGDERLVVRDPEGGYRFHHSLTNSYELNGAMNAIEGLSSEDKIEIEALYESVFQHQMFTGRSGSMFGYEGLGCIYWHMVSKLMVAAQEVTLEARRKERMPRHFVDLPGPTFRCKPDWAIVNLPGNTEHSQPSPTLTAPDKPGHNSPV